MSDVILHDILDDEGSLVSIRLELTAAVKELYRDNIKSSILNKLIDSRYRIMKLVYTNSLERGELKEAQSIILSI